MRVAFNDSVVDARVTNEKSIVEIKHMSFSLPHARDDSSPITSDLQQAEPKATDSGLRHNPEHSVLASTVAV